MDVKSLAKRAQKLAKEYKLISRGLDKAGFKRGADLARAVGYGKKKRPHKGGKRKRAPRRRRRRQQGGSFLGKLLGSVGSIPAGLVMGATAGTLGALKGLGRRGRIPAGIVAGDRRRWRNF